MALNLTPSTLWESWITQLRLPWMGVIGRRIWGGFAAALGDKTYDWLMQGLLEHLPSYASAPSVALIANERQMDTAPNEATSSIAARAPYQLAIWRFAGTPLGMLLGLHFAGFDGAVIVTQNGKAYQLTLPLPVFGDGWDPTPNLVVTNEVALGVALTSNVTPPTTVQAGRSIPAGNSWWAFDNDTDFSSRFAVLFPTPASPMITWGTATFNGTGTAPVTFNNTFADTTYQMAIGKPIVTDGSGAVSVYADGPTKAVDSITLVASSAFTGTVDVLAWPSGANPLSSISSADLTRLKNVITKWRPAKATCVGIYHCALGRFWGWPVRTWNVGGLWGPSQVVTYSYP